MASFAPSPVGFPNRARDHFNVAYTEDDTGTSAFTQYSATYPVFFSAWGVKSAGTGVFVRTLVEIADDAAGTNSFQAASNVSDYGGVSGNPLIAGCTVIVPPGKYVKVTYTGTPTIKSIRWVPIA